jgi:UDP-N-acetylglucosamine 2-epimerase (non-hydrolysing)
MRLMTVLGTRPEVIRLSRLIPRLDAHLEHVLVHTRQNSAHNLSDVFFQELGVRAPDHSLEVDTSSLGAQLATLFGRLEPLLDRVRPQGLLVLGDTNSGLAAFSAARRGIPVYHMEAGNRCWDDRVPEEVNRRVIDHCSTVLLPYTRRSAENLVREGIERSRVFVTGNPIFEVLQAYAPQIEGSDALRRHGVEEGRFLLATLHRAENTDDPAVFAGLCRALGAAAERYEMPLILSVHPRIQARLKADAFGSGRVVPVPAMGFFEFVRLQQAAALVLTDSGTVQEECAIFRVPVVTLRDTTERPETLECGSNVVASTDPERIAAAVALMHASPARGTWTPPAEYLEPDVSGTVLRIILGTPMRGQGAAAAR